ncbi:MAG TPA: hypothetical protein PLZ09_02095 [Clostridia bacterium]|nr:hypothetical protein [Clostridia bacterium]
MKIGDIVEIICNKNGHPWFAVGSVGIITHPYGDYAWMVDIVDPATGEILHPVDLKEEQLRVLDKMPKENQAYTTDEIAKFEKIYDIKESELRNFKEYDLLEIIRDRPEYEKYGFGIGDMGIVCSNIEFNGKIHILANDCKTWEDTVLAVRCEDVRVAHKWYEKHPHKYTEEEKQELIKLSDELAKYYKQKDEERRKKIGY